jgi:hypothetical protein
MKGSIFWDIITPCILLKVEGLLSVDDGLHGIISHKI